MSKLQKFISLSTTESEYVAMSQAGKEMEWLIGFLEEMGIKQEKVVLYSDSQSEVHLAKNPIIPCIIVGLSTFGSAFTTLEV